MSIREKLAFAFLIWLAVYPAVLGGTYALNALDLDLPLPLRILLTTMFTVPLIEFVVLPRAKALMRRAERELEVDGSFRADEPE